VSPSGRRLPSVTAEQLVRALKRAGWYEVKQQGSHLRLRHDEHPADIQIPMHRGDVPKGTVMALIKQAGLTQVEFRELL
jgi:predicted RNA binding protein YcfA (HicA-like mRNA interferase family)